jgi:hypothetical protein
LVTHFAVVFVAWGLAQLSVSSGHLRLTAWHRSQSETTTPDGKVRWNAFDYLLVVVLVTFSAIRYFVGTDYGTYLKLHLAIEPSNVADSYSESPVEIGYTTLSILVRSITAFPYAIFWITSILTVIPMYVAIKRGSRDLPFSILIYMLLAFYINPFNMVRQGIAVALLLLAHTFYGKNRAAYYGLSVLAGLFHYTAWLAALAQWAILRWRPAMRTVVYVVAGTLLVGMLIVIVNIIDPTMVASLLGSINPRYEGYLEGSRSGIGTYLIITTRLALLCLVFVLMKHSGDGLASNWGQYGPWVAFSAIGVCFLTIGTQAVNVGRIDYYFSVFLILLIPNLLRATDPTRNATTHGLLGKAEALATSSRRVKVVFTVLGSVYFAMFIANFSNLIPYQTYLAP